MNECFNEKDVNVRFKPNDIRKPRYMVGFAVKNIKAKEELLTNYGKSYWVKRVHFETLSKETKKVCMSYYNIKLLDLE